MTDTNSTRRLSTTHLIVIPALITLAVTVLRLVGELRHWSTAWFNPEPGGAWSVIGIVWLVPVFGVYFAVKLAGTGYAPPRVAHAVAHSVLGFIILGLGFYLFQVVLRSLTGIVVMWTLAAVGAALQFPTWRALFNVLLAYAYAARVPVASVMMVATWADWQSHYSAAQAGLTKPVAYVLFGFFPQLVWWVAFTIIVGCLFGSMATAAVHRGKAASGSAGASPASAD